MCDLKWYTDKAQPNTWKTHHTLNINTKVNFVPVYNISNTSKTPSDVSWTSVSSIGDSSHQSAHNYSRCIQNKANQEQSKDFQLVLKWKKYEDPSPYLLIGLWTAHKS